MEWTLLSMPRVYLPSMEEVENTKHRERLIYVLFINNCPLAGLQRLARDTDGQVIQPADYDIRVSRIRASDLRHGRRTLD